jgi:aminoacrylate hydrolase
MTDAVMIDGQPLRYEVHGAGEPVIFIPGLGGAASSWRLQLKAFSQRFRCISYDHMGTGQSGRPSKNYTIDGMADDLLALMDALNLDAAHLVGHSTGGAIAQTIACRSPQRVRRMVLHATWPKTDSYLRMILAQRRETLSKIGVEAYLRSTAFFLLPPWWFHEHLPEIEENIRAGLAQNPSPEIMASRIDAISVFDRIAELPSVKVPTLVTAAANDIMIAPYFARQLANLIPNAQLTIFPDGGHVAHQTKPAEFNEPVLRFLSANSKR